MLVLPKQRRPSPAPSGPPSGKQKQKKKVVHWSIFIGGHGLYLGLK